MIVYDLIIILILMIILIKHSRYSREFGEMYDHVWREVTDLKLKKRGKFILTGLRRDLQANQKQKRKRHGRS